MSSNERVFIVRQQLDIRVQHLITDIGTYIRLFDSSAGSGAALMFHQRTIARRNALGLPAAATDNEFLVALHGTLTRWRAFRGSGPYPTAAELSAGLVAVLPTLNALAGESIEDPSLDWATTKTMLWSALGGILHGSGRTNVATPLVGGSKVLHHVLPELVPPMDRQDTGWFMGWSNSDWKAANATRSFDEAMDVFREIALAVQPQRFVAPGGWHTSVTKVIDNALAGAR